MQKKVIIYSYLCMNCYHVERRKVELLVPDDVEFKEYAKLDVYWTLNSKCNCCGSDLVNIDNNILTPIINLNKIRITNFTLRLPFFVFKLQM